MTTLTRRGLLVMAAGVVAAPLVARALPAAVPTPKQWFVVTGYEMDGRWIFTGTRPAEYFRSLSDNA